MDVDRDEGMKSARHAKRRRVAVFQADGPMPNLALAKIAAYYRARGDHVVCDVRGDLVFASMIFDWTIPPPVQKDAVWGGTGYDLTTQLPPEIEACYPDFSLWGYDGAIGFTTRGCIRRCPFCIVPKKEGSIRVVADLDDIWHGEPTLVLLDANLTALPDHFASLLERLIAERVGVDFSQGFDARLVTLEQMRLLKRVRKIKPIHFALDDPASAPIVPRVADLCAAAGIHPSRVMFYVLIGFTTTPLQDVQRIELLRSYGFTPYVMRYRTGDVQPYSPIVAAYRKAIARWARPTLRHVSWWTYDAASTGDGQWNTARDWPTLMRELES